MVRLEIIHESVWKFHATERVCYEQVCYEQVCYEQVCYEQVCYEWVCFEWSVINRSVLNGRHYCELQTTDTELDLDYPQIRLGFSLVCAGFFSWTA